MSTERIFEAAMSLPDVVRAELADKLWASLPEEQLAVPMDDSIRQSWSAEARRRADQIENGDVKLLPGEDVMNELRKKANP